MNHMSMTLTSDDLQAIELIVDDSQRQTAAGFAEVHQKIDDLREVVDRIDRVQQTELERNDRQDLSINQMRKALHGA